MTTWSLLIFFFFGQTKILSPFFWKCLVFSWYSPNCYVAFKITNRLKVNNDNFKSKSDFKSHITVGRTLGEHQETIKRTLSIFLFFFEMLGVSYHSWENTKRTLREPLAFPFSFFFSFFFSRFHFCFLLFSFFSFLNVFSAE
jgi:flagellar biosynthesis protein FlhB